MADVQKTLFDTNGNPRQGLSSARPFRRSLPQRPAMELRDLSPGMSAHFFMEGAEDEGLAVIDHQLAHYAPGRFGQQLYGSKSQAEAVQANGKVSINGLTNFFVTLAMGDISLLDPELIRQQSCFDTKPEFAADLLTKTEASFAKVVSPSSAKAAYLLRHSRPIMRKFLKGEIDPSAGGHFREDAAQNIYQAMKNLHKLANKVAKLQIAKQVPSHGRSAEHRANLVKARINSFLYDTGDGNWTND